jgi:hypothetical protein
VAFHLSPFEIASDERVMMPKRFWSRGVSTRSFLLRHCDLFGRQPERLVRHHCARPLSATYDATKYKAGGAV